MLVAERQDLFSYIPYAFQRIVEEEVLAFYKVFAKDRQLPCLDDSIVNHMSFYHLAICHYHDRGEVIDDEWLMEEGKWAQLNNTYPVEEYPREFLALRADIKNFLDSKGLFYEENWIYTILPEHYECIIKNPPLQSVW